MTETVYRITNAPHLALPADLLGRIYQHIIMCVAARTRLHVRIWFFTSAMASKL